MQASAVTIRGIALGDIALNQLLKIALREIMVGIMMGFVCGMMTGFMVWFNMSYFGVVLNRDPAILAAIVAISMAFAMTLASLGGTFLPIFLHKLEIDPALASGPFVTTGNDLSASLIYFVACYFLLQL